MTVWFSRAMSLPHPWVALQVEEGVTINPDGTGRTPPGVMILPSERSSEPFLAVQRRPLVTGEQLVNAGQAFDQNGQPAVNFRFNTTGARAFADATTQNRGRRFAIVLDDTIISAPVIRNPITGGSGIIEGGFTMQSATDLANMLNAGALPARLTPVEQRTVTASLGADSVARGETAVLIGFGLVIVFMALAYGFFGIVSTLALLANILLLSAISALVGAAAGAVLAWLIVSAASTSTLRRAVLALCSVLAQFGGVALAFAFLATVGLNGVLTLWVQQLTGWNLAGSGWLYSLGGLTLVYTYFQIPLMVIVFMPALEGLRSQWREAAVSLGASTWAYWRDVAVPLLTPAFLGSVLLLFANAFAAYATAAALVSQGSPIVPLLIRTALTSDVVLGQAGFAYALALEMIVVVAVVMAAYRLVVRRSDRWLS